MSEASQKVAQYLNYNMIFLNQSFESTDQLFEFVADRASKEGLVTDQFLPKIKTRESTYPTGLQLENQGVAIPHTDADTIRKDFIAIITNTKNVPFKRMDDPNAQVDVKLAFVLGLSQPHAQLEMLQALMTLLQDDTFLTQIESASTVDDVKKLFAQ